MPVLSVPSVHRVIYLYHVSVIISTGAAESRLNLNLAHRTIPEHPTIERAFYQSPQHPQHQS